jgi:hypothetical protein
MPLRKKEMLNHNIQDSWMETMINLDWFAKRQDWDRYFSEFQNILKFTLTN